MVFTGGFIFVLVERYVVFNGGRRAEIGCLMELNLRCWQNDYGKYKYTGLRQEGNKCKGCQGGNRHVWSQPARSAGSENNYCVTWEIDACIWIGLSQTPGKTEISLTQVFVRSDTNVQQIVWYVEAYRLDDWSHVKCSKPELDWSLERASTCSKGELTLFARSTWTSTWLRENL